MKEFYVPDRSFGFEIGREQLEAELKAIAAHWEQFGASRQDAQAIRDALRMVRDGWVCDVPQHADVCVQVRPGGVP